MKVEIDKSRCGEEYSLCPRCKFKEYDDFDRCGHCTMLVDIGYHDFICGIPVGLSFTHLHRNFEQK